MDNQWRPIETAPVDTPVLVWGRIWSKVDERDKGDPEKWEPAQCWITNYVHDGHCFVDAGFVTGDEAECQASHWMPLPASPEADHA